MTPRRDSEHVQISPRHISAPRPPRPAAPPKELNVLVYLDGESADLSREASEALLNLELAGCDEKVNVVAQIGRSQPGIDGSWTGIRRYEVAHDDHSELRVTSQQWQNVVNSIPNNPLALHNLARALSQEGQAEAAQATLARALEAGYKNILDNPRSEQAEAWKAEFSSRKEALITTPEWKLSSPVVAEIAGSMQDPRTLEDFLAWGMKTYPAKRQVVVMMGHGHGPFGLQGHNPKDLAQVVERASARAGVAKPETMALLACQTASLEAFYTLRKSADFLIAPENPMLSGATNRLGPYVAEVQKGLAAGQVSGEQFARGLVEALSQGPGARAGLTAVRSSQLENVVRAVETCQPRQGTGPLDLAELGYGPLLEATEKAVLAHHGSGSGLTLWSPTPELAF